ncbi:N-acetylglucosamine-6-phosphate deacetylase [Microvirga pudoricolor]|uniref:N-acetylglucosamine-6-phosphate deacetylase n=1 Tax=Microvirga pudoricolor TaxID=2778729 RepID=UPI001950CB25|nr:N-acetylglucosamine-6-phosphate deacetylase [Microvirga pudoricolor]MBM6593325.1 N-acetylglucosamine-6-phosphate deacetylase [Microvirga pudoricolor]
MAFALVGARVFDGDHMIDGRAVVIDGGRIAGVPDQKDLGVGIETKHVEGLLAPGFIDTQVNGGGGVLFNDERSVAGIRAIGEAHRRFGTTGFLPTFITDTRERMAEAFRAAGEALRERVPGVLGIHLEGPFINPERKGVHDPAHMRRIEDEDHAIMTSLTQGKTLVTVAPEWTGIEAVAKLAAAGILVSAGHTAGDHATIMEAYRNGLRGFTHLFNAMPPMAGREPGPVGAALDAADAWCGIIVDGHHVNDASLRVAIAAKGADRIMLVTDAMSSVGSDMTRFDLMGRTVYRAEGRLTTADGTLAGSDIDMASTVRNAVGRLGLPLRDALRMASLTPAAFLGLDRELGRIAPGYRADLVLLDDDLQVHGTWIGGRAA